MCTDYRRATDLPFRRSGEHIVLMRPKATADLCYAEFVGKGRDFMRSLAANTRQSLTGLTHVGLCRYSTDARESDPGYIQFTACGGNLLIFEPTPGSWFLHKNARTMFSCDRCKLAMGAKVTTQQLISYLLPMMLRATLPDEMRGSCNFVDTTMIRRFMFDHRSENVPDIGTIAVLRGFLSGIYNEDDPASDACLGLSIAPCLNLRESIGPAETWIRALFEEREKVITEQMSALQLALRGPRTETRLPHF